jgi:hypothetical protein
VLAVLLVAGAAILVRFTVLGTHHTQAASAGVPVWAQNCLPDSVGELNDQYDGLTLSAAVEHSHQLNRSLILGARDGHCVIRSAVFVPRQVVIALSKGRVILARGPASG